MEDKYSLGRQEREEKTSIRSLASEGIRLPYNVIDIGCDNLQIPIQRIQGEEFFQWIQTTKGCGMLRLEKKESIVPEGHGFLLYPDEFYEYEPFKGEWHVNRISFNGHDLQSILGKLRLTQSGCYSLTEPLLIDSLFRKALYNFQMDYPLKDMNGSVFVYQLLIELHKQSFVKNSPDIKIHSRRFKPVLEYIEENITQSITIEIMAKIVKITPQYFCILFKELTGYRPMEFVNLRRVERAKMFLTQSPELRVGEVGKMVGFRSNNYFATTFRKYEGISPRQYKELKIY